jgi:uncharacterized BrkB/YihY/UPF0761 family membrane protein
VTPTKNNPPVDRLLDKLPKPIQKVVARARGRDIPLFAASLAFYGLVSVLPAVIMVLWIVGVVLGDERVHRAAAELGRVAPEGIGAGRAMQRVADLGTDIGAWSIVTALWPASSYGAGLTRAFDNLSPKHRGELKGLRGRGLALVALFPLFVLGGLVGSFAGTAFIGRSGAWAVVGWVLALLTGFVGAAGTIALIYRIFPPERLRWRAIGFGTVLAAGGISMISLLFTIYLNLGANFQQHYATAGLAGIVLLAVWLFLANVFVLVGFQAALEV